MSHTVAPAPASPRPRHRAPRARPAPGTPDVSVSIATWNCRYCLRDCLESLLDDRQGVTVEVIVVDTASADGAADMVAREFPEVILVRNDQNHGFAKASNQAAALANGRYVFFLNNDTIVPPLALSRLVAVAGALPPARAPGLHARGPRGRAPARSPPPPPSEPGAPLRPRAPRHGRR